MLVGTRAPESASVNRCEPAPAPHRLRISYKLVAVSVLAMEHNSIHWVFIEHLLCSKWQASPSEMVREETRPEHTAAWKLHRGSGE